MIDAPRYETPISSLISGPHRGRLAPRGCSEMGGKKPPPKKSDEEKALEKQLKANESLLKNCKDDEVKKCQEAVEKGADVNWHNPNHVSHATHTPASM